MAEIERQRPMRRVKKVWGAYLFALTKTSKHFLRSKKLKAESRKQLKRIISRAGYPL